MKDMKNNSYSNNWLLLSSYLDDQLDPKAKRRLEERLQNSPTLREDLESLRRTRNVLRAAPQRRVPHSFALKPEMLRKPKPAGWLAPFFSISSAVTAIIAVIVFSLQVTSFSAMKAVSPDMVTQEKEAAQVAIMETSPVEKEQPEIIYWNSSAEGGGEMALLKEEPRDYTEPSMATGYGDTSDGEGYTVIIPSATATPVAAEDNAVEEEMMMESAPSMSEESAAEPQPTQAPAAEADEQIVEETYSSGEISSPILGIQPTTSEEIYKETAPTEEIAVSEFDRNKMIKLIISGTLGFIAVCLAVASWYFWQKSQK